MGKINELTVLVEDLEDHVDLLIYQVDHLKEQVKHLERENSRLASFSRELIMEMDSIAAVASQELDHLKHPKED